MPFDPDIEDRTTGKRGKVFYGSFEDTDPPQEFIPITSWSARVRKHYQDTTNSTSYHPDLKTVFATRSPSAVDIEASIQGNFRINVTPYTWIVDLFSGENTPSRVELWIDDENRYVSAFFTIHDFDCEFPVEGVAPFRATIRNFGCPDVGPFVPIT